MVTKAEIKTVAQIKEILIDVSCNPEDYDLDKTAMEIYSLARADIFVVVIVRSGVIGE